MSDRDTLRTSVLAAAHRLLVDNGLDAVTTRAAADAAAVQAPTLYRLFGDKDGLLDALAESVMLEHADQKAKGARHPDAVEELRRGWDNHVEFALQNPDIFRILAARPGPPSPALERGLSILRDKMRALAATGRLRLAEDRALTLFHASAAGIVLALLRQPVPDMTLSVAAREATLAALTGVSALPEGTGVLGAALVLSAELDRLPNFSAGERLLLSELLARIASP